MNPLLSIIIPTYNHNHRLPALLENIVWQKFRDFEVILVDDCSDEPCDALVEAWQNKGLELRLFRNPCRQYTKDTRLNGVEQARGDLIMFVDADDLLAGNTALDYHVAMQRETEAELLHFQVASYKAGKVEHKQFEWAKPLGDHLTGSQIFEKYVQENLRSHLIYGKIATRGLWQKCLEPARASSVRRGKEDQLLCSLLFFHAQSYVGSDRVGYTRIWRDKSPERALGRTAGLYAMLTELLPYLRSQGATEAVIRAFEKRLLDFLRHYLGMTAERAASLYGYAIPDTFIHEITQHCSVETFTKAALAGFSLQQQRTRELQKENNLLKKLCIAVKETNEEISCAAV